MTPVRAVSDLPWPVEAPRTAVCRYDDLVPDRGVCALVEGTPVAVFRTSFAAGLYAVDNHDPYSGASVLSRGLVGMTSRGEPFVASPLRKQRFDLRTGRALDDPEVTIRPWTVAVEDGIVQVGVPLGGGVDVTEG